MKKLISNCLAFFTVSPNSQSNNKRSIFDFQKSSLIKDQMIAIKGGNDIIVDDDIGG